ncbi:MAG: dihydroxyacetone kinase subunit L [Actinobacteria bacterium]|nr:dihydroxyacetone kinase subunit L [Actinomycetota bacterium]
MVDAVGVDGMVAWITTSAERIEEQKAYLTRLDSEIGDADHGINMSRGFKAALAKLDATPPEDVSGVLSSVGMTMVAKVGGASGPLYGTMFIEMGKAAAGKETISTGDWAEMVGAGLAGVQRRGKAEPGDKTMVDALLPALEALDRAASAGVSLGEALTGSAEAARRGMEATIPLVARKGRASYLGERSAGHQDPGATSSHLLLQAAADTWSDG